MPLVLRLDRPGRLRLDLSRPGKLVLRLPAAVPAPLSLDALSDGFRVGELVGESGPVGAWEAVVERLAAGESVFDLAGQASVDVVVEGARLGESAGTQAGYLDALADALLSGESVASIAGALEAATEALRAGESVATIAGWTAPVSDGVVAGESVATLAGGVEAVSSGLRSGESVVDETVPPAPVITSPVEGATVATPVTVEGTYSGSAATIRVYVDGIERAAVASAAAWSASVTDAEGLHTITARADVGGVLSALSNARTVTFGGVASAGISLARALGARVAISSRARSSRVPSLETSTMGLEDVYAGIQFAQFPMWSVNGYHTLARMKDEILGIWAQSFDQHPSLPWPWTWVANSSGWLWSTSPSNYPNIEAGISIWALTLATVARTYPEVWIDTHINRAIAQLEAQPVNATTKLVELKPGFGEGATDAGMHDSYIPVPTASDPAVGSTTATAWKAWAYKELIATGTLYGDARVSTWQAKYDEAVAALATMRNASNYYRLSTLHSDREMFSVSAMIAAKGLASPAECDSTAAAIRDAYVGGSRDIYRGHVRLLRFQQYYPDGAHSAYGTTPDNDIHVDGGYWGGWQSQWTVEAIRRVDQARATQLQQEFVECLLWQQRATGKAVFESVWDARLPGATTNGKNFPGLFGSDSDPHGSERQNLGALFAGADDSLPAQYALELSGAALSEASQQLPHGHRITAMEVASAQPFTGTVDLYVAPEITSEHDPLTFSDGEAGDPFTGMPSAPRYTVVGGARWTIDGGRLRNDASVNGDHALRDDLGEFADGMIEVKVTAASYAWAAPGVFVRYASANDWILVDQYTDGVRIFQLAGGVFSQLGSYIGPTPTNGATYTLRVEASGGTLTIKKNGATIGTRTTTVLAPGRWGPRVGSNGTAGYPVFFDDLRVATSVSANPVIPSMPRIFGAEAKIASLTLAGEASKATAAGAVNPAHIFGGRLRVVLASGTAPAPITVLAKQPNVPSALELVDATTVSANVHADTFNTNRLAEPAYTQDVTAGRSLLVGSGKLTSDIQAAGERARLLSTAQFADGLVKGRLRTLTSSVVRAKEILYARFDPSTGYGIWLEYDPQVAGLVRVWSKHDASAPAQLAALTASSVAGDYTYLVEIAGSGPGALKVYCEGRKLWESTGTLAVASAGRWGCGFESSGAVAGGVLAESWFEHVAWVPETAHADFQPVPPSYIVHGRYDHTVSVHGSDAKVPRIAALTGDRYVGLYEDEVHLRDAQLGLVASLSAPLIAVRY